MIDRVDDYRARAALATQNAEAETLSLVRANYERAAARWTVLADRQAYLEDLVSVTRAAHPVTDPSERAPIALMDGVRHPDAWADPDPSLGGSGGGQIP